MHIAQLLHMLALAEDIKIVVSALPEGAGRQVLPENHLICRFPLSAAPS
jgi:hypothetical protein